MEAFANRLKKNDRHISKWAKRNAVTCFRVYDHDIPEFPFCVDRYEEYVHVSEYVHRHKMSEQEYQIWLSACFRAVSETLQVAEENIFSKERKILSRRSEQYEKVAQESKRIIVNENGLRFWVNLTDYLDTGLFLDHRPLRQVFREIAAGKKVLNLFSYTGSFSVYAAAGAAEQVITVDMSNTYLNWAKENFALNNLSVNDADFIQSDVMDFLKNDTRENYDLVFVDPPSFSNSKRLKGTWDTQRDHSAMLRFIIKKMKKGGVIYFSNNLRNFKPDFENLKVQSIEDISVKTIPEDFRNKKIHHCYKIIC